MHRKLTHSLLIFTLIAAAMLSLVSCGGSGNSSGSSSAKQSQTASSAVSSAAQQTSEAVTAASSSKNTAASSETSAAPETTSAGITEAYVEYHFRTDKQLQQHFEKHGGEFKEDFGYSSAKDYEKGASDVINNKSALYKTEAEDGDGVYYIEDTNEFVILSTDGYIRTYFRPSGGKKYFDKQ